MITWRKVTGDVLARDRAAYHLLLLVKKSVGPNPVERERLYVTRLRIG